MTREEQAQYIYEKLMENREFRKAFAGAIIDAVIEVVTVIQSLQQEHCGDAISRQAVLDLIEHYNSDGLGSVFYGYEQGVKFADAVNKLPPVTAEKVGHWISNAEDDLKISEYTCSNCKGLSDEDSDFCPKCGSYNGGAV